MTAEDAQGRRAIVSGRVSRAAGPLAFPAFALLFAGRVVSQFGDLFVPVALAFAVLDLTGSTADLGLVMAASTVPFAALLLLGGVIGDRYHRRTVMVASDLVRAGTQGGLAVLLITHQAALWELVVLVAARGAAGAIFQPASSGLVPSTVPDASLQHANALLQASVAVATIAAPAIAGVLVATVGPGWAIAADAVSFLVSALSLLWLRVPGQAPQGELDIVRSLAEGFAEIRSRTWLWVSIVGESLFHFLALPTFLVVGAALVRVSLGGASSWGLILSAFGVGSIVGTVAAVRFHPRHPLAAGWLAMALFSPLLVALALHLPLGAIVACAAVGGASTSLFNPLWQTALQRNVPGEVLSRVSAYDWAGGFAALPAGYVVVGVLSGALGPSRLLVIGGALTALLSLTTALIVRDAPHGQSCADER